MLTCNKKYLRYLIFPISICLIVLTFIYDDRHSVIYVPATSFICSLFLFWLFPSIVLSMHNRPVYYEDLIIKSYETEGDNMSDMDDMEVYDKPFRDKYQKIFRIIITLISSIFVFIVVELMFLKIDLLPIFEINGFAFISPNYTIYAALLGGIITLYSKILSTSGRLLMKILKYFKKKHIRNARYIATNRTNIELGNAGIVIGNMIAPLQRRSRSVDNLTIIGIAPFARMNDVFPHI